MVTKDEFDLLIRFSNESKEWDYEYLQEIIFKYKISGVPILIWLLVNCHQEIDIDESKEMCKVRHVKYLAKLYSER
jgi:hypothetical protein